MCRNDPESFSLGGGAQSKSTGELATYLLVLIKIRINGVKRMTKFRIHRSRSAETKYFRIAARTPSRLRKRATLRILTGCQSTPAINASTIQIVHYINQPIFPQSTEPEPTARAREGGEEFY